MAASNIEGNTLHSAFKFDFSHNYKSLSDKKRDELRNFFKTRDVANRRTADGTTVGGTDGHTL